MTASRSTITIGGASMDLSDTQISHLTAILMTSSSIEAAILRGTSRSAINMSIYTNPGFRVGFNVNRMETLSAILLLEDLIYRDEIRDYGRVILTTNTNINLTRSETIIAPWLFSSLTSEEIADRIYFSSERAVDSLQNQIAGKVLQPQYQKSRYNIRAALLALGIPPELENEAMTMTQFEERYEKITKDLITQGRSNFS